MSNTPSAPTKDAWNADTYNSVASFVYSKHFTSPILELLNAKSGERILDLGCGSGDLTLELKQSVGGNGVVVGVDASHEGQTEWPHSVLRGRCPVAEEISAVLPDSFDYKFDAVFSNAALHWCKRDPRGVAISAAKALRKGGRFVGEMGGYMNIVGLRLAIHTVMSKRGFDPASLDPWYFPSIEDYRAVLESAGFRVEHISLTPRLTPLSSNIIEWQRTFCRGTIYASLDDTVAEGIMSEVQDICSVDCKDTSGKWSVMYCRLRFAAILD